MRKNHTVTQETYELKNCQAIFEYIFKKIGDLAKLNKTI